MLPVLLVRFPDLENRRSLWALMPSIAFICTANRCRSAMAHAICVAELGRRNLAIEVYSAGICDFTDLPHVYETINTCLKHNTPVAKEESTFVGSLRLDKIDRFLAMEQLHADALVEQFGVSADRVSLLAEFDSQDRGRNIADPIGQGSAVYEKCYRQIADCVVNYLDSLAADRRIAAD